MGVFWLYFCVNRYRKWQADNLFLALSILLPEQFKIVVFLYIFSSITVDKLKIFDSEAYEEVKTKYGINIPQKLYFNKGL